MATLLLAAFLGAHGLLHAAIWLPQPSPDNPPPFDPGRSRVMVLAGVPRVAVHEIAVALASAATAGYLMTAVAVAADAAGTLPIAVTAAVLGLALKLLFFHPWLTVGVLLDVLVLTAALAEWPVVLS